MHTFKDESGNEWRLSLSYAVLKRLEAAGLDVIEFVFRPKIIEGDAETVFGIPLARLDGLARILWCWLEPQINHKNITPDEFSDLLGGMAISTAYDEMRQEVLDFLFHTNPVLAAILRKAVEAEGLLIATAENAAQSILLSSSSST